MPRLLLLTALAALLAGCGSGAAAPPGGVSKGEAEALDDAAAMLDARRLPAQALPPEATPTVPAPAEMTGDSPAQRRQ
ncbi:MAG: hypothetical protein GC147_08440 [Porphyrobacter sp.]|nr:hypothetical protein [Porphyrobacter sp.]